MKIIGSATAIACGALALVSATFATGAASAHQTHTHAHTHETVAPALQITVSCQRYISSQVIWDRPRGIFVQDLQKVGYSPADALSIATAICRDERLVGDTDGLGEAMRRYLRANPPR